MDPVGATSPTAAGQDAGQTGLSAADENMLIEQMAIMIMLPNVMKSQSKFREAVKEGEE